MAIGWCARLDQAERVKAIGYGFLEVALAPIDLEDDDRFRAGTAIAARAVLPTPVFNQFLPQDMRIVGPVVDGTRIREYLARAAELMHAARAEMVVFGSGWTRNVPDGWSRETATGQFLEMVSWSTDALDGTGITLALEAQNRKETNFLTTLGEAVALAKAIDHPRVRVIADTYHLHEEQEGLDVVATSAPWLVHVHVSDSERQTPGRGVYDFDAFFGALKAVGYRGRLSVECMTEIPEPEMQRSLAFVRDGWGA